MRALIAGSLWRGHTSSPTWPTPARPRSRLRSTPDRSGPAASGTPPRGPDQPTACRARVRPGPWSCWPESGARPAAVDRPSRRWWTTDGLGLGLVGCCLGEQLQEAGPAAAAGDAVAERLAV